jgi:hypothetical protein
MAFRRRLGVSLKPGVGAASIFIFLGVRVFLGFSRWSGILMASTKSTLFPLFDGLALFGCASLSLLGAREGRGRFASWGMTSWLEARPDARLEARLADRPRGS